MSNARNFPRYQADEVRFGQQDRTYPERFDQNNQRQFGDEDNVDDGRDSSNQSGRSLPYRQEPWRQSVGSDRQGSWNDNDDDRLGYGRDIGYAHRNVYGGAGQGGNFDYGRDYFSGRSNAFRPEAGSNFSRDFNDNRYGRESLHGNSRPPYDQQGSDAGYGGREHRFDPDYQQWRMEQLRNLDDDYHLWRQDRYQKFSDDFNTWRNSQSRDSSAAKSVSGKSASSVGTSGTASGESKAK